MLRAHARQLRAMADAEDLEADALEEESEQPALPPADDLVDGKAMGISPTTWCRACRSGEIAGACLIGRSYKARRSSVEAWLASKAPKPVRVAEPAANDLDAILDRARVRRAS